MLSAFVSAGRGLNALNHRVSVYVVANIVAFAMCFLVVTAPLGWAGLVYLSIRLQADPGADIGDFWAGLRRTWRQGLIVGVVNALLVGVNLSNLIAYWDVPGMNYTILRPIWLFTLVVWLALNMYLWPLFYNLKQPNLLGAFRNAGVMMLLNPGFTVGLVVVVLLVVIISLILIVPWALLTLSALACIANAAVVNRLEAAGLREPAASPPPDEFPRWEE